MWSADKVSTEKCYGIMIKKVHKMYDALLSEMHDEQRAIWKEFRTQRSPHSGALLKELYCGEAALSAHARRHGHEVGAQKDLRHGYDFCIGSVRAAIFRELEAEENAALMLQHMRPKSFIEVKVSAVVFGRKGSHRTDPTDGIPSSVAGHCAIHTRFAFCKLFLALD